MANNPIPPTDATYFRGDTIEHPFKTTLSGVGLTLSDLAYVKFSLKKSKKDTDPLIYKDLVDGIVAVDASAGKYMVVIEPADSPAQTSDQTYFYDIEIQETANNGRVTTVMWGSMTLTNDVTK